MFTAPKVLRPFRKRKRWPGISLHLTPPWRRSRLRLSRVAAFVSRLARSPREFLMTEERLFSRLGRVDALPLEGQVMTIEANPAEREELASFYRLPAIAALTATLRLDPWGQGGARVTGAVHGEVTQECVVSLEPFPATVDEDVDVRFAPQTTANSRSAPAEE